MSSTDSPTGMPIEGAVALALVTGGNAASVVRSSTTARTWSGQGVCGLALAATAT